MSCFSAHSATSTSVCAFGFDLCHKYILYLYLYLYFGWDATYFLLYTIALRCVAYFGMGYVQHIYHETSPISFEN